MKFLVEINYLGTNYSGWQRQKSAVSIQETIENQLANILGQKINIVGCGRTDAGVHADQYFFHFIYASEIKDLKFILNKTLPTDIAVKNIYKVPSNFHAQRDAISRTYDYSVHSSKSALLESTSSWYDVNHWDFDSMAKACELVTANSDFGNFCLSPDSYPSTICRIEETDLKVNNENQSWKFTITGNRFLRGMVRLITGQLIEVGQNRITVEDFHSFLINEIKPKRHLRSYPQGLHLSKVVYPANFPFQVL